MADMAYTMLPGMHKIDHDLLDLRPDVEIDRDIAEPPPPKDDKNVWFYWHQGFSAMHPYTKRNVRAWYRRLSKLGWIVRVVDRVSGSAQNIDQYLDTDSADVFPKAYIGGTLTGTYAIQHQSDLVRFPLLSKYGGIYTDAGFLQIGDIDRLWNATIANPSSPYEIMSYNAGTARDYCLMNYFIATKRSNPLVKRWHELLLAVWAADGGKLSTDGMHKSPLLQGIPLQGGGLTFTENGHFYSEQETSEILTDYIIQGQVMRMVMSMEDPSTQWSGPQYTIDHVFAIEYGQGSQLINLLTGWDGNEAYRLMSLKLPSPGQEESTDQAKARDIVEQCLTKSFGFKLATGLILRVLGETLSSHWRRDVDSDDIPGTYAHWLRYAMIYWTQDELPQPVSFEKIEPVRIGPLITP